MGQLRKELLGLLFLLFASPALASSLGDRNLERLTFTGNNLNTNASVSGGTGSSAGDKSTFTFGTTSLTLSGCAYQTTATSNPLTTGQGGVIQCTAQRAPFVNLRDSSGNELGLVTTPMYVQGTVALGAGSQVIGHIICDSGCASGGASTPADAFANPTTAGLQMGFNMGWNGTTWDRYQLDSNKYLKITAPNLEVPQGSTTAGQIGPLVFGAATTSAPSLTTAKSYPLSMDLNGAVRVNPGALSNSTDSVTSYLAAGTNVIGHVILDSGTVTAVTAITNALPAGTNVIGHVILDSGTLTTLTTVTTVSAVTAITNALPAGTNLLGKVTTDQTTPGTTDLVHAVPQVATSGGTTFYTLQPTASDNHANIKNGAGLVYGVQVFNNSATVNYLRLYNAASGFNNCNSATNLQYDAIIPASTSGAGFTVPLPVQGLTFSTGISICVTSGYANNDTTSATASAMTVNIQYN